MVLSKQNVSYNKSSMLNGVGRCDMLPQYVSKIPPSQPHTLITLRMGCVPGLVYIPIEDASYTQNSPHVHL